MIDQLHGEYKAFCDKQVDCDHCQFKSAHNESECFREFLKQYKWPTGYQWSIIYTALRLESIRNQGTQIGKELQECAEIVRSYTI